MSSKIWFKVAVKDWFLVNHELGQVIAIRFDCYGEPIYTLELQDGALYTARQEELVRLD